jgi:adenosylcobinamide-GDP ribazoletransferase
VSLAVLAGKGFLLMAAYFERVTSCLVDTAELFRVALSFLTILPVPPAARTYDGKFGRSVAFFPLVGALIGGIVAGAGGICGLFLPRSVVTVFDLMILTFVTGALHLDGLMDSCDGLLGSRDRERRLEIMRDSRVGSFGVLGGSLILLLDFAALASLNEPTRAVALVIAPTVGRWAMVLCMWAFPYARVAGHGTAFQLGLTWRQVAYATVWTGLIIAFLMAHALWLVPAMAFVAFTIGRWIQGRLGGLTGDSYGAVCELVTAATLVALSSRLV